MASRRGQVVLAAIAGASVLIVTLLLARGPWSHAREVRDATSSSPALSALFSRAVVLLRRGDVACNEPVTFLANTGRARFRMRAPKAPGPRVAVEASGPGYRATATTERLPVQTEGTVVVEFRSPGREVTGKLCWRNRGPTPVQLIGTNEGRSLTLVETSVNGRPRPGEEIELILFARGGHSLLSRRRELVERASSLTGGLAPGWLLWPIALLLAGSPLLLAGAYALSVWHAGRR